MKLQMIFSSSNYRAYRVMTCFTADALKHPSPPARHCQRVGANVSLGRLPSVAHGPTLHPLLGVRVWEKIQRSHSPFAEALRSAHEGPGFLLG